jgi:hypothetical protein
MSDIDSKPQSAPRPRASTIGGWAPLFVIFALSMILFRYVELGTGSFAAALGLILFMPWIVGPLAVKLTHWSSANPNIAPIDPFAEDCPEAFIEIVPKVELSMAELGFRSHGHLRVTGAAPNGEVFVTLFDNPKEKQTGQLFTIFARSGPASQTTTAIGFTTEFTDGTKLATSNSPVIGLTPPVRIRDGSGAFPTIRGPRRLYQIHQACLAHYCGDAIRMQRSINDPADFLRQSISQETAKFAESGYYYLDEKHERYRPTWGGAFLMAWKSLWPVKPIRRMIRIRKAERMLRELGLGT